MATLEITKITLTNGGPSYTIEFEWNGVASHTHVNRDTIDDLVDTPELLMAIIFKMWKANNPSMSNPNVILNKLMTIDWSLLTPIVVSPI